MKRLLTISIASASIAIGAIPAVAEVDSKTHKLCLEAKDYLGCVKAMKGETSSETVIRQVQQQGANLTEGNSCPEQHMYSGGGYCQRVTCIKRGLFGKGHDQYLGGKGISCKGGAELTWDNTHQPIRASFNKDCPGYEPDVGYQSTCAEALDKGFIRAYSAGFSMDDEGFITKLFAEPAKSSGLIVGDKLISLAGRTVAEHTALANSRNSTPYKKGELVEFKVSRKGRIRTFSILPRWVEIPLSTQSR